MQTEREGVEQACVDVCVGALPIHSLVMCFISVYVKADSLFAKCLISDIMNTFAF